MLDDTYEQTQSTVSEIMTTSNQRTTIARLTTACESIIHRGLLAQDEELALRILTNQVCNAFDMAEVQDNERYLERA